MRAAGYVNGKIRLLAVWIGTPRPFHPAVLFSSPRLCFDIFVVHLRLVWCFWFLLELRAGCVTGLLPS